MGGNPFYHVDRSQIPLYVPHKSISEYKTASIWEYFNPILPIDGEDKNTYTIRFVNYDNTELLKLTDVEEGTLPAYTGATPTRLSDNQYTYTFSGWTPTIVAATADATYTATYVATPIGLGVENIQIKDNTTNKVLHDGQFYILRGEKIYTIQGQEVK